ncbi:hypothetical protein ACFL26_01940 [Patescibacteria group bacterium]
MNDEWRFRVIASLPPYAEHRQEIIDHPLVSGLRFNTVWDADAPRAELLARLRRECGDKPLWIDLKARQLRVTAGAFVPYSFADISHPISVDLPVEVRFKDCTARAVELLDGGKRIVFSRPPRTSLGRGQPLNIIDPSLEIHGFLTEGDREYARAAVELGLHDYMLSFYEGEEDERELREIDPEARIVAKVESQRGLDFVRSGTYGEMFMQGVAPRLMAARDDLGANLIDRPLAYIDALWDIAEADANAICASRILTSLQDGGALSPQDLSDFDNMMSNGYMTFMLSDGMCLDPQAFRRALEVMAELFRLRPEGGST